MGGEYKLVKIVTIPSTEKIIFVRERGPQDFAALPNICKQRWKKIWLVNREAPKQKTINYQMLAKNPQVGISENMIMTTIPTPDKKQTSGERSFFYMLLPSDVNCQENIIGNPNNASINVHHRRSLAIIDYHLPY